MLILDDVVWNLANVTLLFFQIDIGFFLDRWFYYALAVLWSQGHLVYVFLERGYALFLWIILVRQCVKCLFLLLVVVSLIRFGFHPSMQLICYSLSQNNYIVINCCFETASPLILVLNNVVWDLANIVLPFSLIYVCCFFLYHSCYNTVEKLWSRKHLE